jgi:arylsulfatase A-like enzyme
MASLMTGLYQLGVTNAAVSDGRVSLQPPIPQELPVLTELLQRHGYRTFGIAANAHLAAELGFGRGFDRSQCLGFTDAPQVVRRFAQQQQEIAQGAPYLLWVHLFDPHSPYFRHEPWLRHAWRGPTRPVELENITPPNRYEALNAAGERLDYIKTLYHGEVSYSDAVLGSLLAKLRATDPASNALIIVLSDHGEEFAEHGRFIHGRTLYEESVRIPFVIRFPGRRFAGRVISAPVSLVDVLPTLLDALGIARPAVAEGVSLLPWLEGAPPAKRELYAELAWGHDLAMVLAGGWKLIHRISRPRAEHAVPFGERPREHANGYGMERGRAEALTRLVLERLGRARPRPAPQGVPLGQREVEALKAMGYAQ